MEAGDSRTMAIILKQYKHKSGEINFPAVFTVPSSERLPALYQKDFMQATALVVAALTMAFERMSLKKMTGELINNIAEEIINSCDEDNLSLEDLILFLQGMVRGKYGEISEISVAKFMNLFDKYRGERTLAIEDYRYNQHLHHKGLGDSNRSAKEDPLSEHFSKLGNSLTILKEQLKETKQENKKLKDIDKW